MEVLQVESSAYELMTILWGRQGKKSCRFGAFLTAALLNTERSSSLRWCPALLVNWLLNFAQCFSHLSNRSIVIRKEVSVWDISNLVSFEHKLRILWALLITVVIISFVLTSNPPSLIHLFVLLCTFLLPRVRNINDIYNFRCVFIYRLSGCCSLIWRTTWNRKFQI